MTIEVMVFALWVAALFLVFWQIVISIQFSRISGDLKLAANDVDEGWNLEDLERLCQTMASEIVSDEAPLPVDEYLSENHNHPEDNYEIVGADDYLQYLENRIDSLENLIDLRSSAGHFAPHMTQYDDFVDSNENEFTDDHYIQPLKVAVNDWPTPVRLRRVR